MIDLIFFSLVSGLFSLIGGLLILWKDKLASYFMTPLISFGAGAFLGAAFFDILPEAMGLSVNPKPILTATVVGFVIFFLLERLIMKSHKYHDVGHEHSAHTETLPILIIIGDCLHNFMDGIVIAIAYLANPLLGMPTALAIASHEIPQEIGDFSILLNLNWDKRRIIAINVIQSLFTIPGAFIGYFLGKTIESYLPLLLGATAGIFLYISASDLIPELHHRSGHKQFYSVIIPFASSLILLWQLSYFLR